VIAHFFRATALAALVVGLISPAASQVLTPHQKLHALFKTSDENSLRRDPLGALARGDKRYSSQFGDYISDDYFASGLMLLKEEIEQLKKIDRATLTAQDRLAFDVFQFGRQTELAAYEEGMVPIQQQMPLNHMNGMHTYFPNFSSGAGIAPFKTAQDYENNLKRLEGFVTYLQRCEQSMRDGIKNGYVQPKLVTENMIRQFDTLLALPLDKNPFFKPTEKMPSNFSSQQRASIKARYQSMVVETINPALKKLNAFLASDYLAASRDNPPGLLSMRDGAKVYAYLIRAHTTTDMSAQQIHEVGLQEVARIAAQIEEIRKQVKFNGDKEAFFKFVREDSQFKPSTREGFVAGYKAVYQKLRPQLSQYFSSIPKSPLEIRPIPQYAERGQAGAYYESGSPDGKRPGVFYLNTSDLPSRSTMGMETLFLHEAIPGHHFQISLAQENAQLPPFMRFGGNTAFVEGWALYAESLGPELGLFKDPWQMLGRLSDEMLRAMRLVIDTGLHSKGWTRQQSIDYFLANNPASAAEAQSEVERYIADPGQALAYKLGQLKISELRARAQARLGKDFDIRRFHRQVLATGALPLLVLEKKIDDWISQGGKL
jgi:uncharacterized protein (DUF885 family)